MAAMATPVLREGALFALRLRATDISLLGIGAPFRGLLLGVAMAQFLKTRTRA